MDIPDYILNLARELHTQDNRIIENPIFCVQRLKWIPTSEDYADGSKWVDRDYDKCDPSDKDATEVFYKEEWITVQPFLTEVAAKEYIHINGHNIMGDNDGEPPRIYVESGWRNEEWRQVRAFLMGLTDNGGLTTERGAPFDEDLSNKG